VTTVGVCRIVAGYASVPAYAKPETAQALVVQWRRVFAARACREGYAPGPVFTDLRGRDESSLYELAAYLRRDGVIAVVVPDLKHLTHAGCLSGADRRAVQPYLRAAVLTVTPSGVRN
jgi:hypothetical protein